MSGRILRLFQIKTVRSAWVFLVGSVLMFLFPIYILLAHPEQIAPTPAELVSDVAFFSAWFVAAGSYIALASWALFSSAGRHYLMELEARPIEAHPTLWPLILRVLKVLFASYALTIVTFVAVLLSAFTLDRQDIIEWVVDHLVLFTALSVLCWFPIMWRNLK